jgi:hypothetical protein
MISPNEKMTSWLESLVLKIYALFVPSRLAYASEKIMNYFLWFWNTAIIHIGGAQVFILRVVIFTVVNSVEKYNWNAVDSLLRCDSSRGKLKQW